MVQFEIQLPAGVILKARAFTSGPKDLARNDSISAPRQIPRSA
jgi:hypothetical protein